MNRDSSDIMSQKIRSTSGFLTLLRNININLTKRVERFVSRRIKTKFNEMDEKSRIEV